MDTYGKQFNAAVAAELRAERAAKQMTVDALAAASGVPKGTLLRYLNAQRDIPVPALADLASALSIDPAVVLDRASLRVQSENG